MPENGERRQVIQTLCAQLQQDNDHTRWCTVKALGRMGAREAIPALVASLGKDPDPDVRMEAAATLGQLADNETVDALIGSLRDDPDGDVRIEACRALGRLRHPRAVEALITCLSIDETLDLDDWDSGEDIEFGAIWEIQREALERLGDSGDIRAAEAIIELLASVDDDDLQELGLHTLATLGGDRAIGFVLQQLREGSPATRRHAVRALAVSRDTAILEPLRRALQDSDPDVRLAAGQVLAIRQDSSVLILLQDSQETIRREAVPLVSDLSDDTVGEQLIRLLNDPKRSVRQQAVQALGERRDTRAIGPMLMLLAQSQKDETLAGVLIKSLRDLKAPEAMGPLCQLLVEEQVGAAVRLQAVLALGDIASAVSNADDPVECLTALVGDDDPQICHAALISLSKIGGDKAAAVLLKALRGELPKLPQETDAPQNHHESMDYPTSTLAAIQQATSVTRTTTLTEHQRQIRQYSASVIRETHDMDTCEALVDAAEDGDPILRCNALLTIGQCGYRGGLTAIHQGCTANERDVRLAAIEVLRRFAPKEALGLLTERLDAESDPVVMQRVIETLGTLGDKRATAGVIGKLRDDDQHVQRTALHALSCLRDRTAIEAVRPLLFDYGGELWRESVNTLQSLDDPELCSLLLTTLSQPEREEHRGIAIEALAELYAM